MRLINTDELKKILENHKHYLARDCDGWEHMRADLRRTNLREADLYRADLRGADLYEANLYGADLREANLRGVDLRGADLYGADLRGADLYEANLYGADLRRTNLRGVDLRGADLRGADLRGADLYRADLYRADLYRADLFISLACPSEGEFIGWKKVNDKLVKLRIPTDAKRSSATTSKCRCDKALVEGIYNLDGTESGLTSVVNIAFAQTSYNVGEMVYPDSYDENRWNECSHGIYFFVDKESAVRY